MSPGIRLAFWWAGGTSAASHDLGPGDKVGRHSRLGAFSFRRSKRSEPLGQDSVVKECIHGREQANELQRWP